MLERGNICHLREISFSKPPSAIHCGELFTLLFFTLLYSTLLFFTLLCELLHTLTGVNVNINRVIESINLIIDSTNKRYGLLIFRLLAYLEIKQHENTALNL